MEARGMAAVHHGEAGGHEARGQDGQSRDGLAGIRRLQSGQRLARDGRVHSPSMSKSWPVMFG
jgi:hypothetical protein